MRWGGGSDNPSVEELKKALAELATPDPEHPDTWLEDEEGWLVAVHESGRVILAGPDSRPVCQRDGVSPEDALQLWLLLQQGQRDEIMRCLSAQPTLQADQPLTRPSA